MFLWCLSITVLPQTGIFHEKHTAVRYELNLAPVEHILASRFLLPSLSLSPFSYVSLIFSTPFAFVWLVCLSENKDAKQLEIQLLFGGRLVTTMTSGDFGFWQRKIKQWKGSQTAWKISLSVNWMGDKLVFNM